MNIVTDNLQQIIDAPDGIKRLRELILQLAVQGKLVEQRAEEISINELKTVKAAKEKIKTYSTKRTSKANSDQHDDSMMIPPSWNLVRFDEIAAIQGGIAKGKIIKNEETVDLPYLRVANVQRGFLNLSVVKTIKVQVSQTQKYTLSEGDLLITEGGDWDKVGRTAIWRSEIPCCVHQNHIFRARLPLEVVVAEWIVMFLNSVTGRTYFAGASKQTTNLASINMTQLRACPIPLPPLPEQQRIVAKVHELMGWCDQLEELKQKRETLRKAALKSSLLDLTAQGGKDAASRIFDNFAALIRTPEDVKQIRDAILQLAVQGRLVEQRPEDGTAADLIKEIKQAKAADQKQRKANGERVSKTNPLPPISAEEIPFDIPENWEWVRLGNILKYGESKKVSPDGIPDETWILELEDIEKNTSIILQRHTFEQRKSKSSKTTFKKGDVLYGKLRPYLNKAVVADADGVCTTEIVALEQYTGVIPHYTLTVLKSPYFINHVNELTYGVKMPRLGTNDAKATGFPLPPLPEQKRIVAKVDELMSWCDELDALLTSEADTAMRFAAAVAKGG